MKNDYFNTFESGDIEIRENIELNIEHSNLFVVMEEWFDVDKKFGINVNNDDNVWVNLFADYQPFSGELRIFYDIDADKKAYEREYIPTDEEKELFVQQIEQACEQQTKMSCKEFYVREYAENYADSLKLVCEEKRYKRFFGVLRRDIKKTGK